MYTPNPQIAPGRCFNTLNNLRALEVSGRLEKELKEGWTRCMLGMLPRRPLQKKLMEFRIPLGMAEWFDEFEQHWLRLEAARPAEEDAEDIAAGRKPRSQLTKLERMQRESFEFLEVFPDWLSKKFPSTAWMFQDTRTIQQL